MATDKARLPWLASVGDGARRQGVNGIACMAGQHERRGQWAGTKSMGSLSWLASVSGGGRGQGTGCRDKVNGIIAVAGQREQRGQGAVQHTE
jgi:hypothetical protein